MSYHNVKSAPTSFSQLNSVGLAVSSTAPSIPTSEFYELEPAIVLDVILDENHPEFKNKIGRAHV